MAIRRDLHTGKRVHSKGRRELFAKTARMTTATHVDNLDSQGNTASAGAALQDEVEVQHEVELQDEVEVQHEVELQDEVELKDELEF